MPGNLFPFFSSEGNTANKAYVFSPALAGYITDCTLGIPGCTDAPLLFEADNRCLPEIQTRIVTLTLSAKE